MGDPPFDALRDKDGDAPRMRLLKGYGRDWRAGRQQARALGERHQRIELWVGIPGALAGVGSVVALATQFGPLAPWILALLGACAALGKFLDERRKADRAYGRFDCLGPVIVRTEGLATEEREPTQQQLDDLALDVKKCGDAQRSQLRKQERRR